MMLAQQIQYTEQVESIVEFLEDQGCKVQFSSLQEVVVDFLQGELSERYLQHRYHVTGGHSLFIFSLLKKLPVARTTGE